MPSLQQGGTRWRPALEEVRRTIKLHRPCARAAGTTVCCEHARFLEAAQFIVQLPSRRRVLSKVIQYIPACEKTSL